MASNSNESQRTTPLLESADTAGFPYTVVVKGKGGGIEIVVGNPVDYAGHKSRFSEEDWGLLNELFDWLENIEDGGLSLPRFCTPDELAEVVDLHPDSIRAAIRSKSFRGGSKRKVGRNTRYRIDTQRFLSSFVNPAAADSVFWEGVREIIPTIKSSKEEDSVRWAISLITAAARLWGIQRRLVNKPALGPFECAVLLRTLPPFVSLNRLATVIAASGGEDWGVTRHYLYELQAAGELPGGQKNGRRRKGQMILVHRDYFILGALSVRMLPENWCENPSVTELSAEVSKRWFGVGWEPRNDSSDQYRYELRSECGEYLLCVDLESDVEDKDLPEGASDSTSGNTVPTDSGTKSKKSEDQGRWLRFDLFDERGQISTSVVKERGLPSSPFELNEGSLRSGLDRLMRAHSLCDPGAFACDWSLKQTIPDEADGSMIESCVSRWIDRHQRVLGEEEVTTEDASASRPRKIERTWVFRIDVEWQKRQLAFDFVEWRLSIDQKGQVKALVFRELMRDWGNRVEVRKLEWHL